VDPAPPVLEGQEAAGEEQNHEKTTRMKARMIGVGYCK